jgi:hypothetical protein
VLAKPLMSKNLGSYHLIIGHMGPNVSQLIRQGPASDPMNQSDFPLLEDQIYNTVNHGFTDSN